MGKKYTDDELLEKLNTWAKINKKSPTARDIEREKSMPSPITYKRYFGSFNRAKELTGLEIRQPEYAIEELIDKLKKWAKTNKKNPTVRDIDRDKSTPSASAYVKNFGSFNKAKEFAGLEIRKRVREYSDEELLEKLKTWAEVHKKSPFWKDIQNDRTMPMVETYKPFWKFQ